MTGKPQRREVLWHAAGVLACIALGWFGIVQAARIPILADALYGFHEFGHLIAWPLPDVYRAMAGSLVQILIPLGLAGYFLLFQRDLLGAALMLAWAGVSVNQTALYIADAPSQLIELSARHTTHDWAYALSELGRMAAADELAWILQGAALTCIFLGMGVSAWGAVRVTFEGERAEHVESFLEGRPVVGPGNYDEWMQQEAPDPSTEETAPPGSG